MSGRKIYESVDVLKWGRTKDTCDGDLGGQWLTYCEVKGQINQPIRDIRIINNDENASKMSITHEKGEQKWLNVLAKHFVRKESEKVCTIRPSCTGNKRVGYKMKEGQNNVSCFISCLLITCLWNTGLQCSEWLNVAIWSIILTVRGFRFIKWRKLWRKILGSK